MARPGSGTGLIRRCVLCWLALGLVSSDGLGVVESWLAHGCLDLLDQYHVAHVAISNPAPAFDVFMSYT